MSHAESPAHYASGTQQLHLCDPEHWDPDGECVNNPNVGGVPLGYGGNIWSLVGSGGVNPTVTLPHPSINITTGATLLSPLNLQSTHHWKWNQVQPGHFVYNHLSAKGWTHHKIQGLVLPSSQHHTSIGNIYLNDLVHSGQGVLGAPNYVAPLQSPAFLYNMYQGWAGNFPFPATPSAGGCNSFAQKLGSWESNLQQAVLNTPQATQEVINFWQSRVNWVKCMIDKCCCTGCPTFTLTQTAKLGTQGDALSTHPKWDASLGEYLENEFET